MQGHISGHLQWKTGISPTAQAGCEPLSVLRDGFAWAQDDLNLSPGSGAVSWALNSTSSGDVGTAESLSE